MSPHRRRSRSFRAPTLNDGQRPDPFTLFQVRLRAGDYEAIVGRKLGHALRVAAADPGIDFEIGAVRLALLRLLQEEADPSRLAAGVARLSAVAVQASRLRSKSPDGLNEFHDHFVRVLAEIDAENEAARAALLESVSTDTPTEVEGTSGEGYGHGFGVASRSPGALGQGPSGRRLE